MLASTTYTVGIIFHHAISFLTANNVAFEKMSSALLKNLGNSVEYSFGRRIGNYFHASINTMNYSKVNRSFNLTAVVNIPQISAKMVLT